MLSLINLDDPNAPVFIQRALGSVRTFGLSGGDYQAIEVQLHPEGSQIHLASRRTAPGRCAMQLVGSFNVSNALAALALACELGVDPATAAAALAEIPPVDGRFQRVPFSGANVPTVVRRLRAQAGWIGEGAAHRA